MTGTIWPGILITVFLISALNIIKECEGDTEIRSVSFDPREGLPGKPLCVNARYSLARNRSLQEISFETYTAKIFSYGKNGSLYFTNNTWGNRTDRVATKQNRFCFTKVYKEDEKIPFRWRIVDSWNSQAMFVFTLPIAVYPDHPPHIIFFFSEYEYDVNYVVNVACYLERVRPYPTMVFLMEGTELEGPYISRTEVIFSDDQQYYDVQKRLTMTITESIMKSHDNVKKPLVISCRAAFGQYNQTSSITVKLRERPITPPPATDDDEYFVTFGEEDDGLPFTKRPATTSPPVRTKPPKAPRTTTPKPTTPAPTRPTRPPRTEPPTTTTTRQPTTRPPPPTLAPTRPPPRIPTTRRRVIVPTTTTTEEPVEYTEGDDYYVYESY